MSSFEYISNQQSCLSSLRTRIRRRFLAVHVLFASFLVLGVWNPTSGKQSRHSSIGQKNMDGWQAKRNQQTFPSMSTLERYRRFVWNLWQRSRPDAISNKRSAREHENSQKVGQLVEVGISRITGDKISPNRTEWRDQILQRSDLVLNPAPDLDLTSDRDHYIGNHSMILYLNDCFVCLICP